MTNPQQLLSVWKGLREKLISTLNQLKTKSVDNYPKVRKITLLGLTNIRSSESTEPEIRQSVSNLLIINGQVTKSETSLFSNTQVSLHVEHLEVIVLKDLTEDNWELTN